MTYTALVMYPNDADIQFNEEYYIKSHMPLVENIWNKHGLKSWHVTKFPKAFDGSRSEYLIMATLEWESEEAFQAGLKDPAGGAVFADVPNFTNAKPITLAGARL